MSSKQRDHWPNERISLLIALYRRHECLWNTGIRDYKNKNKRTDALQEIGIRLGITRNELVRKIHNLRNQFNGEMKKVQKRNSELEKNTKSRWEYYDKLSFLEQIITPRPGFNNSLYLPDNKESVKLGIEYTEEENSSNDPIHIEEIPADYTEQILQPKAELHPHSHTHHGGLLSSAITESEITRTSPPPKKPRIERLPPVEQEQHLEDDTENYSNQEEILHFETEALNTQISRSNNYEVLEYADHKPLSKHEVLHSRDEWDVFGEFVSSELRNLNSDISKKKLKRRIMQSILEIANEDDGININIKLS